jgi:hypothetical protein
MIFAEGVHKRGNKVCLLFVKWFGLWEMQLDSANESIATF